MGSCDILVNGAGGNHPLGTTSNRFLLEEDLLNDTEGFKTFFDLDAEGIKFVFNLNFIGTLLPTQVFSKDIDWQKRMQHLEYLFDECFYAFDKNTGLQWRKSGCVQFYAMAGSPFFKSGHSSERSGSRIFLTDQNRALLTTENGELTERGNTIIGQTPMGRFGEPEDLISTTLYLCDDASSFVTGVVIPIDGGFSAFSGV